MTKPAFDHEGLLKRHDISISEFHSTGLEWPLLDAIWMHHQQSREKLQIAANYISQLLQTLPDIHSVKVRIKDPDHLVAKIIRKKLRTPALSFTVTEYSNAITDLIGLRALHLFKDTWRPIHDFVSDTWQLHETPKAYVRAGDPQTTLDALAAASCEVTEHELGYRSIHYLLKLQPAKQREQIAELQVRTIFEEGWSEIDHRVRYPNRSSDVYLANFLAIFNRLAGSADEMGTFIQELTRTLGQQDKELTAMEANLKKTIADLNVSQTEKDDLKKQVAALRESTPHNLRIVGFPAASMATIVGSGQLFDANRQFSLAPDPTTAVAGACQRCKKPLGGSSLIISLGEDLTLTVKLLEILKEVHS